MRPLDKAERSHCYHQKNHHRIADHFGTIVAPSELAHKHVGLKGRRSRSMNLKLICYWVLTITAATELLVGAEWDLTQRPDVVQLVTHLGYPTYVLTILGFWKLLAVIAWLVPGFPRLKEWAYAGVFFETTGAAASHVASGNKLIDASWPLILAALGMASWALRPQSRRLTAAPFSRTPTIPARS
jgi:DoxX-like protein